MFDPDSLIGKKLDQFRLDQYVARGAMGMVYKAFDTVLMRTVALKLIPKANEAGMSQEELATREEARKRLIQEAKAAGRLSHPNIVTIHSYGETEDYEYICMEYVPGKTLSQILREQKIFPIEEAIPIIEQVLLALESANREQIVHRDIKPSNVMVLADGRTKVMDFGIAKLPSFSMTVTGTVLGTPYYMSPEQISGQKVDIRSDLFSVGAVLYEIVTGERPFDAENTATLAYKIVQVDPIPPKILNIHVPETVGRIISKALTKDPNHRYQTPAEMLKDLRAVKQTPLEPSDDAGDSTLIAGPVDLEETVQVSRLPAMPSSEETMLAKPSTSRVGDAAMSKTGSISGPLKTPSPPAPPPSKSSVPKASDQTTDAMMPSQPPPLPEDASATASKPPPLTPPQPSGVPASPRAPKTMQAAQSASPKAPASKASPTGRIIGVIVLLALAAAAGFLFLGRGTDTKPLTSAPATSIPQTTVPPEAQAPPTATAAQPAAPAATEQPPPAASTASVQSPLPTQVDALVTYAKDQMSSNPDAAQKALEQACNMDPGHFEAAYQLARLFTQKKDYAAAMDQYQKAIAINNQSPEAYFNLGCIYMSRGDYDSAIINFESTLGLNPSFQDEVQTNLGICYLKKGSPAQAQHYFRQAVAANPNNTIAKGYLAKPASEPPTGSTAPPPASVSAAPPAPAATAAEPTPLPVPQTAASGPPDTQTPVFPTAEVTPPPASSTPSAPSAPFPAGPGPTAPSTGDQAPPSADSLVQEAKNRIQADPVGAQQLLEEAVKTNPNHFGAQFNLARLLTQQKNYPAAIRYYQSALRLNNRAAEIYFNLGYIYMNQGAYELAAMNYESCIALTPSYKDEALTNLGIVRMKTNKTAEAKALFQQALELNPNNRIARNYLNKMGKPAPKSAPGR